MITATKTTKWKGTNGRDLVSLDSDGAAAAVHPARCDAGELRDLAEACLAAADALQLMAETEGAKVRIAE